MTEWKEIELGNVVNLKRGYDLPHARRQAGEIPVYSSSGIFDFHSEAMREPPGVITGRYGTIGEVFFAATKYWPLNTTLYVEDFKGNDPRFVYYLLKNLDFEKYSDKSAVPGLNRNDVHQEIVRIPNFQTQQSIAEVLSSLDDKIDLLHRQNKTIESLAQTHFRHWFIDQGKPETGSLSDILELHYGKTLKEESRSGQGFPVVGSNGIIGYHDEALIEGPGIVIGRKGTLGKVTYLFDDFFPIDTTYFIKSKLGNDLFYEYFLLKSLDFGEMNSDSAVPGLNRDIALATEVFIPDVTRRNEFNKSSCDLFLKIRQNTDQIRSLVKLRDSLLPKLMTGEVNCG